MIKKIRAAPPAFAHVQRAINPIVEIHNKGYIVDSDTVKAERTPDGRVRLKIKPETIEQNLCHAISFSATVSGSAAMIGEACAACTPISVSGSVEGSGAFCCSSGDPVPCVDCDTCIFTSQAAPLTLGVCEELCSSGNFSAYIELNHVGSDYELFILATCGSNFGDLPLCAGTCAITDDNGNTYNLGSDPTGAHTFDFTGDLTGASYHFVITIT
jgi:hypothetical protein